MANGLALPLAVAPPSVGYVDMERARNDLEDHQLICVIEVWCDWDPEASAVTQNRPMKVT